MRTLAVTFVLAAMSVLSCSRSGPPAEPKLDDVVAALRARDAARLGQILDTSPALASARLDGTSVLLSALFLLNPDKETFIRPQENPFTRAILAHQPAMDVFDAAAAGDDARVGELVASDAGNVRATHPSLGTTALHLAAFAGQAKVAELLLAKGAEVNAIAKNKFHNTPLVVAALASQRDVAAMLLAKGADPNVPEEGGFRALHVAAQAGDAPMIALLLDHGATLDARADDGATPLEIAKRKGRDEARALLEGRAKGR